MLTGSAPPYFVRLRFLATSPFRSLRFSEVSRRRMVFLIFCFAVVTH